MIFPLGELPVILLVILLSSLSTSVKTLERSIDVLVASSSTVTLSTSFATVGASSTAVTLIVMVAPELL